MNWKISAFSIFFGFGTVVLLREILPSGFDNYLPIFAGGLCASIIIGKKGYISGGIVGLMVILIEISGLYMVVGGFHAYGYEVFLAKIYAIELGTGFLGGWMGTYIRNWFFQAQDHHI